MRHPLSGATWGPYAREAESSVHGAGRRIREAAWPLTQTTAAAVAAWSLAQLVLPEPRPAFAPLGAIIALGATAGERGARAIRVAGGVAVGLAIANVAVRLFGVGAWQLGLVTSVALLVAVAISSDSTLVVQAGVSGALVVAVGRPETVFPYRFLEALVGGVVALAFSQLLFPVDPVERVREAAQRVLEPVAGGLREALGALRAEDDADLASAHRRLREASARLADVDGAVAAAGLTASTTRRRRRASGAIARFEELPAYLEALVSDTSALLRAASAAPGGPSAHAAIVPALGVIQTRAATLREAFGASGPARGPAGAGADAAGIHDVPSETVRALVRSTLHHLDQVADALGDRPGGA